MPVNGPVSDGLPEMVLRLAGEAGQVSLARTAGAVGMRASVDQHASEIRDALTAGGRQLTPGVLLTYAQGFVEAAIGRGWWPQHRRAHLALDSGAGAGGRDWGADTGSWDRGDGEDLDGGELEWESLRLAAVCRMVIETQGLGV